MTKRPLTWEHGRMPRPATGETPRRAFRAKDEVWQPAVERAEREGRTMSAVLVEFLAHYGRGGNLRSVPDPAAGHEADPWDVINTIVREIPGANLGPTTDLQLAGELAGDLLRALGVRPAASPDADESL